MNWCCPSTAHTAPTGQHKQGVRPPLLGLHHELPFPHWPDKTSCRSSTCWAGDSLQHPRAVHTGSVRSHQPFLPRPTCFGQLTIASRAQAPATVLYPPPGGSNLHTKHISFPKTSVAVTTRVQSPINTSVSYSWSQRDTFH